MDRESRDFHRGVSMVKSVASALDAAKLDHWFFGGWAVDFWVGRLTRQHDDIDVLVWRHDEDRIDKALQAAGWVHKPTSEDRLGTSYVQEGYELQLTFVVPSSQGEMVVPVPEQPIVLSNGPLPFILRTLSNVSVRVVTLDKMLEFKATPRLDEVGGSKDRADLEALRALTAESP